MYIVQCMKTYFILDPEISLLLLNTFWTYCMCLYFLDSKKPGKINNYTSGRGYYTTKKRKLHAMSKKLILLQFFPEYWLFLVSAGSMTSRTFFGDIKLISCNRECHEFLQNTSYFEAVTTVESWKTETMNCYLHTVLWSIWSKNNKISENKLL
jgi:hypothetical protein